MFNLKILTSFSSILSLFFISNQALAENIGQSRIAAGLHYPSDHLYSKWLLDNNYIV